MPLTFVEICCRRVEASGVAVGRVVDSGAQNCIVISHDDRVVFRFPRHKPDRVAEVAERHARAHELGLPTPPIKDVAVGGPGEAHMVMPHASGTPLQDLLPALSPMARHRAAEGISELLLRLRAITAVDWPFPAPSWPQLWSRFADDVRHAHRSGLAGVTDHDLHSARRAAATAASAPVGLVHGDLAWGNILFSDTGRVEAILDWDFAVVGDPAVDVTAVQRHIPAEMVQAFREHHPHWAGDAARFEDYITTWDLQYRLQTSAASVPAEH